MVITQLNTVHSLHEICYYFYYPVFMQTSLDEVILMKSNGSYLDDFKTLLLKHHRKLTSMYNQLNINILYSVLQVM